jgi:enoyl-CoA hydratase/carnithine racemase
MTTIPHFSYLTIDLAGVTATLWLNRPEKLNALSLAVLEEITTAADWFNSQREIRTVTIAGRGRAFSAGADLDGFPLPQDPRVRPAADAGRVMADAVESIDAITIARIHGWCVGGGLVLAAACDLRVASSDTRFSIPEVDLGIPLAWGGIPRLVREIGPAMTKELVMTCRPFTADEAKSLGFLNRVVEAGLLNRTVAELVDSVARKPRLPIDSTKHQVNAVSQQSGDTSNAWSDADGLLAGLKDEECQSARAAYMQSLQKAL